MHSVVQYRGISGLVGLAGLVWSAKNVFGAISYGLDRSLGVPSRHFLIEIVIAVVLVPLLGVVLIVSTAVPLIITYVVRFTGIESLRFAPQIGSYVFAIAFVFAASAAIYTYLPNRRTGWAFGIPGAVVTTIGYSIAQVAFVIYTAHANFLQIYGQLSAVFAVMLWVYLICTIFLYGAHVSAQWERHVVAADADERVPATPTLAS
jgi:membrane protein